MAKNEFLPFGIAEGANVLSNQEYERLAARFNGFVSGVAKSKELNTVWRQSSVMSSALAQFVVDSDNKDLLDNGDIAGVKSRLVAAIKQTISGVGYVTTAAMNLELNKKFDKANISGVKGNNNDKVPSLNLFTTETGKLATKAELSTGLAGKQPTGNYATVEVLNNGLDKKFDKAGGSLAGYLSAQKEVSSNFDGSLLSLITSDKSRGPHLAARRDASSAVTRHNMPEKSGTLAQIGDGGIVSTESYKDANAIEVTTFTASDGDSTNFFALYQPAISVKRPGGATGTGFVLQIQGNGTTEIAFRQRSNDVWRGWYKFLTEANTTKDANGFVRTGAATALITSQVAQSTGSSTANVMSQKAVTDAVAAVKTLGDGQKWTDVTSGRQSGVNYTNSTGRTIALFVCTPSANASSSIVITVDGVVCSRFGVGGNSNDFSRQSSGYAIIPAGSTYRIIAAGSIGVWSELR